MSRLHVPNKIRWSTYTSVGFVPTLAHYFSFPAWWGWSMVILLTLSTIFYGFFEPYKYLSIPALWAMSGVLGGTLIAWLSGRTITKATTDLLFAVMITLAGRVIYLSIKSKKGK